VEYRGCLESESCCLDLLRLLRLLLPSPKSCSGTVESALWICTRDRGSRSERAERHDRARAAHAPNLSYNGARLRPVAATVLLEAMYPTLQTGAQPSCMPHIELYYMHRSKKKIHIKIMKDRIIVRRLHVKANAPCSARMLRVIYYACRHL